MDFSKVTNITIPQGNVTKITDASGNVLWQKDTTGNTFIVTDDNVEIGTNSSTAQTLGAIKDYSYPTLRIADEGTLYIHFYDMKFNYSHTVNPELWSVINNTYSGSYTPSELRIGDVAVKKGETGVTQKAGTYEVEIFVEDYFEGVISTRDTSLVNLRFTVVQDTIRLFDSASYGFYYASAIDSDENQLYPDGWNDGE